MKKAQKLCFFYFFAAAINPLNNGPGLFGLDLNSGWNWPAMKNG